MPDRETHTCETLENEDYIKVYLHKQGNRISWFMEDTDFEDNAFLIFFCPFCGIKLPDYN